MLRARRERPLADHEAPATEHLSTEAQRRQDLRDLLGDVARLPEEQRAALVLAELGAVSHDEIALVLNVPRQKVKALVFQARTSLAASRKARETPCEEIREQVANLRGGALRRTTLHRHLRECAGCRAFRDEVALQRKTLAVALPVIPTVGLKEAALGAAFGSGSAGGGAAAVSASGALAAKALVAVALVGGGTTAGVEATHRRRPAPARGGAERARGSGGRSRWGRRPARCPPAGARPRSGRGKPRPGAPPGRQPPGPAHAGPAGHAEQPPRQTKPAESDEAPSGAGQEAAPNETPPGQAEEGRAGVAEPPEQAKPKKEPPGQAKKVARRSRPSRSRKPAKAKKLAPARPRSVARARAAEAPAAAGQEARRAPVAGGPRVRLLRRADDPTHARRGRPRRPRRLRGDLRRSRGALPLPALAAAAAGRAAGALHRT